MCNRFLPFMIPSRDGRAGALISEYKLNNLI